MSEELDKLKKQIADNESAWNKERDAMAKQLEDSTKANDDKSVRAVMLENTRLKKEAKETQANQDSKDIQVILDDLKEREFDIKNFKDLPLESLKAISKSLAPLERDDKGVVIPKKTEEDKKEYRGPMMYSQKLKKLVPFDEF